MEEITKLQMHPMDKDKTTEMALYMFEIEYDGKVFGGEIPAKSYEAAKAMAESFGATLIGRAVERRYEAAICAVCKGDIKEDVSEPKPLEEEFPDIIE
jgi:hydrogenase maturation factor HypF (carbamoyltransferase family)